MPERSGGYDRIKAILLRVVDAPAAQRAARLDELCAGDATLRAEVMSLLAHEGESVGGFVGTGAAWLVAPTIPIENGDALPSPSSIGPYAIRGVLGQGGMGTVYRAEQIHPIRREVALKLIRHGLDTSGIVARFAAERQTLALMDHPHIAKVLDAGASADGRPYVVLELVDGVPLLRYCDEHRLSIEARLSLFLAVCQGVQHAHQRGIIHRDLKPSNVLVRTVDGVPVPKVIDFGIAKAIGDQRQVSLLMTQVGQVVGTPEYMSPEQAGVLEGGVDTRTDVYSLGVMLYEVLTGHRPYEFNTYSPVEIQRVLRDTAPVRPSAIVTRKDAGRDGEMRVDPASVGVARRISADRLRRRLAGDLDNIVLRAMAREPDERYGSVEQLADDLRRHAEGRPVQARPATWRYQAQKFVRRHRAGVASAAAIAVLLVAAAVALAVQASRIAAERDRAQREAETAKQVSVYITGLFQGFNPWDQEAHVELVVSRRILDRAAARVRKELGAQPTLQASLLHSIGTAYRGLGDYGTAAGLLRAALATRRRDLGPRHPDVAATLNELGWVLWEQDDFEPAQRHAVEALALRRELLDQAPLDVADSLNLLGHVQIDLGRWDRGEAPAREAVALYERLLGVEHGELVDPLIYLTTVLIERGEFDAGEATAKRALAIGTKAFGERHPWTLTALGNIAWVARMRGDYATAERIYGGILEVARKVAPGHPRLAFVMLSLGRVLNDQGEHRAAVPILREGLQAYRTRSSPNRRHEALTMRELALSLDRVDREEDAEPLYLEAIEVFRRHWPNGHLDLVSALQQYALLLLDQGEHDRAEAMLREALDMGRRVAPTDDRYVAEVALSLGGLLARRRQFEEAERLVLEAERHLAGWGGPTHPRSQFAAGQVAALYRAWGRPEEAARVRGGSPAPR
jgi:serine/threonine protein kinase/tetratricopeptide (TPR) repeat protein